MSQTHRVLPIEVQRALVNTQKILAEFDRAKAVDDVMRKARQSHPRLFKS